jgi:hypothetical protein
MVFGALARAQSAPDSATTPDTLTQDTTPAYRIVSGGPVSVAARLKPRRGTRALTVGDPFELELTVKYHRKLKVSQPFSPEFEPFLALDRKSVTRYVGDTIVDVHTIKVAPFNTGELKVPPFVVVYPSEGEVLAAASDSIPLTVKSVLPEKMEDINDIKPQVQFPNLLPLWIALGLVGALLLGFAGFRLYRRYRRLRLYGTAMPDPWDEALAALDAIPVSDWLEREQVKRFYYAVSEILKRYLTRRFEFPAIDQTTTEIARSMKQRKVEQREGFDEFFQRADLVKYAKYIPPRSDVEAVLDTARELVRTTRPAPEPAGATAQS